MKRKLLLVFSLSAMIALSSCNSAQVVQQNNVRNVEVRVDQNSYLNFVTPADLNKAFEAADLACVNNPNITDEELEIIIVSSLKDSAVNHSVDEIYYPGGTNRTEFWLSIKHPVAAFKVKNCADKALQKSEELYDDTYKGNGDAFRHCYWNILMVKAIGKDLTEKFATAHEADSPEGVDKEMDLNNNSKCREWADSLENNDDAIINAVIEHVNNGDLLRIINVNGVEKLVPTTNENRK